MLMRNYPVYFVFDGVNDSHYTDTLLELGPEAYLWHEIRRRQKTDIILFASRQNKEIVVRTFDACSAKFLAPRKVMSGVLKWLTAEPEDGEENKVVRNSCALPELEQKLRGPFAPWFKKAAGQSDRNIALVISWDVFAELNQDGILQELPDNCTLLVRLAMDAEELEKALLTDRTLAEAFPQIGGCLGGSPEPLLTVLDRQLDGRMIRLDDQESDVRNMLLRQAFTAGELPQPLKDLQDQAAVLHLCRQHRCLHLIDPDFRDVKNEAIALEDIFRRPGASKFRKALERRAAEFRTRYPESSMSEALQAEGWIGDKPCEAVTYQDELARDVRDLVLPEDFLERSVQSAALEQIKRDLTTLWNCPCNAYVRDEAKLICARIRRAIMEKDWETLSCGLELLEFCGKHICIGQDQNDNLKNIFTLGREVLELSGFVGAKKKIASNDYEKYTSMAIDYGDRKNLEALRTCLRDEISVFNKPDISPEEVRAKMERSVERKKEALARVEEDIRTAQEQQKDTQIQQKYLIDDAPAPARENYDAEQGRRSAEKLLRNNFIPL